MILAFVALAVFSGFYISHLENKVNDLENKPIVTTERIVTVTKYDTIKVESKPITLVKYVKTPVYIGVTDSTYLDSVYTTLKDSALLGKPAIAEDTISFGKDHLETAYTFPPISKFSYKFLPGPDTLIYEKTTVTRTVDKTPQLALFFGPKMIQEQLTAKSDIGVNIGLRIKNISGDMTWSKDYKIYGVNYHVPIRIPTFRDIIK